MPSKSLRRGVTAGATIALTTGMFVHGAAAGESQAPEQVLITARPPDPVGNDAFSTTILDEQRIQIDPQLAQEIALSPEFLLEES